MTMGPQIAHPHRRKMPTGAIEGIMDALTITPLDNGPSLVKGLFRVVDELGREIATGGTIALCRCGGCANKPFCDGNHARIGFHSIVRAANQPVS
jgi:CDGSH-type Zn-finger protein